MTEFRLIHRPAYFNARVGGNIPEHWIAESLDDERRYDGHDEADVRRTTLRFVPDATFLPALHEAPGPRVRYA